MPEEANLDRKRLYKNSLKLYLRTFYTLAVGLYNTRVVLEVLGIDDFGVYSLIGSLSVMFAFFTGAMSSAMSRFFAYELAGGNARRLRDTFGTALIIVAGVVIVILLAGEAFGFFFIDDLNIPEDTRSAAAVVYQLSLATVIVNIPQTCYLSAIIAREKMGVFALLDMSATTLKLAAIFMLKYIDSEKLILYSTLVFGITLCMTFVTAVYCRRNFTECRTGFVWNGAMLKSMVSYSGWNLFKTLCDTLRPSGINVLVNLFFGVVINGAVGIATNVSSNLAKFTANVFLAFKPQIIKSYAMGAVGEMSSLLTDTFKFSLLVLSLMVVPFFLEMHYVIDLWLGECPPYAAVFCRLLCLAMFFEVIIAIIEFGVSATGRIRGFCLANGLITVGTVVVGWVAFKLGAPPQAIYIVQICLGAIAIIVDVSILHSLVPQLNIGRMYAGIGSVMLLAACVFGACTWIHAMMPEGFLRLLAVGCADVALTGGLGYRFMLSESMRRRLRTLFSHGR